MNNKKQLISWGSDYLASKDHKLEQAPEIVIETPWSTVIRFLTSKGCFYLKQTPVDLFIEPMVIEVIQKNKPDAPLPTILFKNPDLNCFLMRSCGDYSLRTKFNGSIDEELLVRGLHSYINILRSFENNLESLLDIGVPDWRIQQFPNLYVNLLEKSDMLISEGLTKNELDDLMSLVPAIQAICDKLSLHKIKQTLVNGDFNENNLIIDESDTEKISIIDWGESVITHPFFTVAAHLKSIARRYQLQLDSHLLETIKQRCLSCWLDSANQTELNEIYQNIVRLLPIFSSLAIYRLQSATANRSKEKQNWFIAPLLKAFIKNEKAE